MLRGPASYAYTIFVSGPGGLGALPSFPTRRSSDLRRFRLDFQLRLPLPALMLDDVGQLLGGIRTLRPQPHAIHGLLAAGSRSEEQTSELQSPVHLVCRLLLEKKKIPAPPGPHAAVP